MHPRDEELFGRKGKPGVEFVRGLLKAVETAEAALDTPTPEQLKEPYHKWYKIVATSNTDDCGSDLAICSLIADYGLRAMKKGGVEVDDAREFESALRAILDGPIAQCDLCTKIKGSIRLNKKTKVLTGQVTIPCKDHGCLDWKFEIGKGVDENV